MSEKSLRETLAQLMVMQLATGAGTPEDLAKALISTSKDPSLVAVPEGRFFTNMTIESANGLLWQLITD